jgi:hypothetical protein
MGGYYHKRIKRVERFNGSTLIGELRDYARARNGEWMYRSTQSRPQHGSELRFTTLQFHRRCPLSRGCVHSRPGPDTLVAYRKVPAHAQIRQNHVGF